MVLLLRETIVSSRGEDLKVSLSRADESAIIIDNLCYKLMLLDFYMDSTCHMLIGLEFHFLM